MKDLRKILKNCPSGMELDCTLCENVFFDKVIEDAIYPIILYHENNGCRNTLCLTEDGKFNFRPGYKCVIFPKGKTSWEGFAPPCQFKDGDIIYNQDINAIAIFHKQINDNTISHCFLNVLGELKIRHYHSKLLYDWKLATEEKKKKLFDTIKANGYKWNEATKTLEKLIEPKFKVGNKIKYKDTILTIIDVQTNNYIVEDEPDNFGILMFSQQDKWELINEPKFKVGDKIIRRKGYFVNPIEITAVTPKMYTFRDGSFQYVEIIDKDYELVSRKFNINTLKPFESKVLVRSTDGGLWKPALYGFSHSNRCYVVGGACWKCCIPYKGNEYLLGTTDACNDYYKTWE